MICERENYGFNILVAGLFQVLLQLFDVLLMWNYIISLAIKGKKRGLDLLQIWSRIVLVTPHPDYLAIIVVLRQIYKRCPPCLFSLCYRGPEGIPALSRVGHLFNQAHMVYCRGVLFLSEIDSGLEHMVLCNVYLLIPNTIRGTHVGDYKCNGGL